MFIADITQYINSNRPRQIYRLFSKELKWHVSYRQFKHIFKTYAQASAQSEIYLDYRKKGSGEVIWYNLERTFGITMTIHQSKVIGIYILPIDAINHDEFKTKNKYIMPVKDKFEVYWGGDNTLLNYHFPYENQRYAYDLTIFKNGETHRLPPQTLEDFYCFGSTIVAPLQGKVITVVNNLEDQPVGELDEKHFLGNHAIIQHNHCEFSLLAHLKNESILVQPGDFVHKGQMIAQCGNTGNSTEPHLHFQVMNHEDILHAKALKIDFFDGKNYEKGDCISGLEQMK